MPVFAADGVAAVLHSAIDGLSTRQDVIADNIANVDTPGFRATSVDFESSLRDAVAGAPTRGIDPAALTVTTAATDTPAGPNGNNVDLRKETVAAMQTVFQYQLIARTMSDRLESLRTAAGAF